MTDLKRATLTKVALYRTFTPSHLYGSLDQIEVGASLLMVSFPFGFHDTPRHTPVVVALPGKNRPEATRRGCCGVHLTGLDASTRNL